MNLKPGAKSCRNIITYNFVIYLWLTSPIHIICQMGTNLDMWHGENAMFQYLERYGQDWVVPGITRLALAWDGRTLLPLMSHVRASVQVYMVKHVLLLLHGAPHRVVAVVHTESASELVHVPYLNSWAGCRKDCHAMAFVRTHAYSKKHQCEQTRTSIKRDRAHLTSSCVRSVNRKSLVDCPSRWTRRMEPSSRIVFLSNLKLCFQGASLKIHHQDGENTRLDNCCHQT